MSQSAERMMAELVELGYRPEPFKAPEDQGGADGVKFDYRIKDGSRSGETVGMGFALHPNEGEWPEVAPHWLYLSPPDFVLAEQVRGSQSPGAVSFHESENGIEWMAVSAPPNDFWDRIEFPDSKGMRIFLGRHIRRIWAAR